MDIRPWSPALVSVMLLISFFQVFVLSRQYVASLPFSKLLSGVLSFSELMSFLLRECRETDRFLFCEWVFIRHSKPFYCIPYPCPPPHVSGGWFLHWCGQVERRMRRWQNVPPEIVSLVPPNGLIRSRHFTVMGLVLTPNSSCSSQD